MAGSNKDMESLEDWQSNKTLSERNAYMLENCIATDVTFLVSCDASAVESGVPNIGFVCNSSSC